MLRKKAFIFSLDAIFAVLIAGLMLMACFFALSKTTTNIYRNQDVFKISLDSLTILEKDGTLETAVETNSTTTMQSFLNSLPDQFCGNMTVYNSSETVILSAQKTGCAADNESTSASRTFIAEGHTLYYASMKAWYR